MYQKKIIKILAIIALVLTGAFFLHNIIGAGSILAAPLAVSFLFYAYILSAALLLWASIIGLRLSSYKVNKELYNKIGRRVYAIFLALVLNIVDIRIGAIASAAILAALFVLKKSFDEWYKTQPDLFLEMDATEHK